MTNRPKVGSRRVHVVKCLRPGLINTSPARWRMLVGFKRWITNRCFCARLAC